MKKILVIHNKYRETGGEDIAVSNEIKLLEQKFKVKVLYFDNNISNLFLQKGRKLFKLIRDNRKECLMINLKGEKIERVVSDFVRLASVQMLSCYECELTNYLVAGWHSLSNLKVLRLTKCLAGDGFNGRLDLPYSLENLELEIDENLAQKHLVLDVSNLKTLIIKS